MRPKTVFLDIDGTILFHHGSMSSVVSNESIMLDSVLARLDEWDRKGYQIILTTGRKENLRGFTCDQLTKLGIFWVQLIMGITGGTRVIINDRKPNSVEDTAVAINLDRNLGLTSVNI